MQTSKKHLAAALFGGLSLAATTPAFTVYVDPSEEPVTPLPAFVLGEESYERTEFITESFVRSERFSVTQAGTYELSLTDLLSSGALRKLGAFVADPSDTTRLVHLVGDGSVRFDLRPGMYSLNMYAKPFAENPSGQFALKLHLQGEPAAVPVPAALWLLGSGLVGLAGVMRRKRIG